MFKKALLTLTVIGITIAAWSGLAGACGGFFCLNDPVDQTGERIVFTANSDGTITTLIEILYQGEAADFSWILPIPEAIDADALQVPEEGQAVFTELHQMTDVQIIAPEEPECAIEMAMMAATADAEAMEDGGVEIFASGEIGPFGFDVIGSEDPNALIDWLRDSNYQVTPEMEPLIDVYVELEMAFVAMRLLDGETADSITPIEITYGGTEPMIPLQLTAVAAQPNMPIWVWIFGETRAVPTNFEEIVIANEELTFFPFGSNDYQFLVQQRANALDGRAFITEFAQPVTPGDFDHPWLAEQSEGAPYLTRLNTFIDPEEMTADPTFTFDDTRGDVSNIRDATGLEGLYSCQRDGSDEGLLDSIFGSSSDAIDPTDGTGQVVAFTPEVAQPTDAAEPDTEPGDDGDTTTVAQAENDADSSSFGSFVVLLFPIALLAVAGGFFMGRRRGAS